MVPARRVLPRILLTLVVSLGALAIGVNAIVQAGKPPYHPFAPRAIEDRVDELLDPVVAACGREAHAPTPGRLAAMRRSIGPLESIARRYGDLYYPSFINESEDVTYGALIADWVRTCRAIGVY